MQCILHLDNFDLKIKLNNILIYWYKAWYIYFLNKLNQDNIMLLDDFDMQQVKDNK